MNTNLKPVDAMEVQFQESRRPVDIFEGFSAKGIEERLKRQAELRNAFLKFVRGSMKKNTHYMPPTHKGAQPYLKQEGALLLTHFWQCENDYQIENETDLDDFYAVTIKCYLKHPSGKTYVGIGWASSRERNFETRIAREGIGTVKETIGQMARKRALVSAARHLPFVSELFTSEGENGEDKAKSTGSGGISQNSEEALKQRHNKRLNVLMGWAAKEWKTSDDEEIKKRLGQIVGEDILSKSEFVETDDFWDKFVAYSQEIQADRAHNKE